MTNERRWQTPVLVLLCGAFVLFLALGTRQAFGLYLKPITDALGIGRGMFSLAIAIQALMWGVAQPIAGAIADRSGLGRVIAFGGASLTIGTAWMALWPSVPALIFGLGFLAGTGIGCASFSLVLAAVARLYPAERRSFVMGVCASVGSLGMFVMVPVGLEMQDLFGWRNAILGLGLLGSIIILLALALVGKPTTVAGAREQTLSQAIGEALTNRSFLMLGAGYFVCGFHLTFIATHLPTYLVDRTLSLQTGAWALSLVGLFNVVGSFLAGLAGQHFRKTYSLAAIYLARAVVIAGFVILPLSEASALIFASLMGLLWLSTVPLTTGVVAQMFGLKYMATLSGVVFLSHQIGSFLGVILGGYLYDLTGSYNMIWGINIALGVFAALINWPIDDRAVQRQPAPAGA